jgi:peptide-methionine (S)-S-oxide reductase
LFLCSEHVFEAVVGVDEAFQDMPEELQNPSYEQVFNNTGHAEAIAVYYDPKLFLL